MKISALLVCALLGLVSSVASQSSPAPPASTPVPPASTPVPPASTPVPPASTPVPPASTTVPPVSTPAPTPPPTTTPDPTQTKDYQLTRLVNLRVQAHTEHVKLDNGGNVVGANAFSQLLLKLDAIIVQLVSLKDFDTSSPVVKSAIVVQVNQAEKEMNDLVDEYGYFKPNGPPLAKDGLLERVLALKAKATQNVDHLVSINAEWAQLFANLKKTLDFDMVFLVNLNYGDTVLLNNFEIELVNVETQLNGLIKLAPH